jgi:hypothetical protein
MATNWQTVAPVTEYVDSYRRLSLPFKFSNGVILARFPEWARQGETRKLLSGGDAMQLGDARLAFTFDYEADAVGTPHPSPSPERLIGWQDYAVQQFVWVGFPSGRRSCSRRTLRTGDGSSGK